MPTVSVRDKENNRWKRNAKKDNKQTNKQTNKDKQKQERTEAIVKGWEINDFAVHLS